MDRKAFEHSCIHAGGRAVIKAVEQNLGLSKVEVEASEMMLYKFWNTSSSFVWYVLVKTKGRIKTGDRVWQIAFGSGFKCNSAVWKCRSSQQTRTADAWEGKIETDHIKVKPHFRQ
ncbi:hypothetical protein MLD38_032379 [Melastoma candidum]|uniref:Uncharacterized protein n=1 Tax=Melastoma candidum TaxID=119954 RepID=A0ACB9M3C2_9MYRT|nr:hypothetical protein MLD38_032379 [Melastoma candidum]